MSQAVNQSTEGGDDMLSKDEITLVVTSAMARYALENHGKRGLSKEDVIDAVASFGGDVNDVRTAMVEGIRRIAPDFFTQLN